MTATSGPGFSLMQEGLGLAVMLEAPIVIVNNMRTGPSTGIATQIGQGDIMQSRWGSHGPYGVVVYAPSSAQETYDYTIKAFNTAIRLRLPVIMLMDAILAHTREKVILRDRDEVEIVDFKKTIDPPDRYLPYKPDPDDLVPPIAFFGEGYNVLAESLAHDERGYYTTSSENYKKLVSRFIRKVDMNKNYILSSKEYYVDDVDVLFVAIGSLARSTLALVRDLRRRGVKAGLFKPISLWPIDSDRLVKLAEDAGRVVVLELNQGQLDWIVKKTLWDADLHDVNVYSLPLLLPDLPGPDDIMHYISERGWNLW